MASTMFGTAAPLQSFATQRTRNNSGGSTGSSVSSMDSDLSTPMTPLTPTTPAFGAAPSGLQVQDYQTIANMLSQNTAMHTEQVVKSLASRYKTELCRSYSETGICKYGDKCQFAHGGTEVKCLPRHPKYKSELCRTFHTSGFCPYGPRCHFIHSEDESKLTEINLMKQQAAARQATQQMMQQAARLRAQQQALQQQMQTLVLSQLHIQMAQKQLTPSPITTQRPMFFPQMSVPVPQTQQMSTAAAAAMIRKAALERTVSMPSAYSNLGSVIDTPPITPPCGSPTFNVTSSNTTNFATTSTTRVVPPPPGFPAKPMNVAVSSMEKHEISFPTTSACVNLDFGSNQNDLLANDVNDILSRLNSMELESLSSQSEIYTPSTSPDSVQSPLDSPRCGRLPVFSQFSDLQ